MNKPTALVTGANRGIGFEIARRLGFAGYRVIACGRDLAKMNQAVGMLRGEGHEVVAKVLDVTDWGGLQSLREEMEKEEIELDALVNNAAVLLDRDLGILDIDPDVMGRTLTTNTMAPLMVTRMLLPLIKRGGRVVMMSSGAGAFCQDFSEWAPIYSLSKTALNALTRQLAPPLLDRGIMVNAVCPGWVQTSMGGSGAPRTIEQGAETPVWLATEVEATGKFWRDKQEIAW
jgi:NAD(P)-dependent dehydrogenase (short-subunit alcohol dehydrogenase family)